MSPRSNQPEADDRIATEAAAWVLRQDRGLSAVEQDALSEWLSSDPRHREALLRHRRQWSRLDALADWRPEHGEAPNPDLLTAQTQRDGRRTRMVVWSFAAAASLALLFALQPLFFNPDKAVEHETQEQQPPPDNQRRLADGSVIELNLDAAISLRYTPAERRVVLERGEAHFTVAKDPERPFVVEVGSYEVRAIGTAFNIRNGTQAVEVLVTEGTVGLATQAPAAAAQALQPTSTQPTGNAAATKGPAPALTRLDARQRAVLPPAEVQTHAAAMVSPQIATLTPGEIERVLAWQHRMLEFSSQPLAEIVAEFNRRNRIQLVIADPDLAGLRVSAKLRSDNVAGFVRLLERGFGARAERRGDREIELHQGR